MNVWSVAPREAHTVTVCSIALLHHRRALKNTILDGFALLLKTNKQVGRKSKMKIDGWSIYVNENRRITFKHHLLHTNWSTYLISALLRLLKTFSAGQLLVLEMWNSTCYFKAQATWSRFRVNSNTFFIQFGLLSIRNWHFHSWKLQIFWARSQRE